MERHRCKLCSRIFANGKALGGHMRSHMMNLYAPKNASNQEDEESLHSYSSTPSSSEEEESGEIKGLLSSIVLQDGESETESQKENAIFRKSKRARKSRVFYSEFGNNEQSPLSSISDTTPEENVAYCLMMLSRDKWEKEEKKVGDFDYSCVVKVKKKSKKVRGKYRCETCSKFFRSYQALGGHRASHKKIKAAAPPPEMAAAVVEEKLHECPFCHRVFPSGQALGGHKRSHFVGGAANVGNIISPVKLFSRSVENLDIDLNLPAPNDDY